MDFFRVNLLQIMKRLTENEREAGLDQEQFSSQSEVKIHL